MRRAPDEVSKILFIGLFDVQIRKTGKMKDKYYLEEKVTLKKPWGWKIAQGRKQTYLHQPKYSTPTAKYVNKGPVSGFVGRIPHPSLESRINRNH